MNVLAGLILLVTQPSLQHQYHEGPDTAIPPSPQQLSVRQSTSQQSQHSTESFKPPSLPQQSSMPTLPPTHSTQDQPPRPQSQAPYGSNPPLQSASRHTRKPSVLPQSLAEQNPDYVSN